MIEKIVNTLYEFKWILFAIGVLLMFLGDLINLLKEQ